MDVVVVENAGYYADLDGPRAGRGAHRAETESEH